MKLKLLISTKTGCEGARSYLNRLYWQCQWSQQQLNDKQINIFHRQREIGGENDGVNGQTNKTRKIKHDSNMSEWSSWDEAYRRIREDSDSIHPSFTVSFPPSLSPSLPLSSLCRNKDGVMKLPVVLTDLCSSEETTHCSNVNPHPPFNTSVLPLLPLLLSSSLPSCGHISSRL